MTLTEKEMDQAIQEAKAWINQASITVSKGLGDRHIENLLEIIEAQKGAGLVAWAEIRELKRQLEEIKNAHPQI